MCTRMHIHRVFVFQEVQPMSIGKVAAGFPALKLIAYCNILLPPGP